MNETLFMLTEKETENCLFFPLSSLLSYQPMYPWTLPLFWYMYLWTCLSLCIYPWTQPPFLLQWVNCPCTYLRTILLHVHWTSFPLPYSMTLFLQLSLLYHVSCVFLCLLDHPISIQAFCNISHLKRSPLMWWLSPSITHFSASLGSKTSWKSCLYLLSFSTLFSTIFNTSCQGSS